MGQRVAAPAAAATVAAERSERPRRRRRRNLWPYGFVAPAALLTGLVFLYPIVQVIRYSFYAGSTSELTYVGTANYRNVVHDPVFTHSVLNNLKLLLTVPVMTALALLIALMLNAGVRGWR